MRRAEPPRRGAKRRDEADEPSDDAAAREGGGGARAAGEPRARESRGARGRERARERHRRNGRDRSEARRGAPSVCLSTRGDRGGATCIHDEVRSDSATGGPPGRPAVRGSDFGGRVSTASRGSRGMSDFASPAASLFGARRAGARAAAVASRLAPRAPRAVVAMSDPTPAGMSWLDNFKSSAEKAATQAKQTLSEGATKMSSAIAASAQGVRAATRERRGYARGIRRRGRGRRGDRAPASSSGPAASSGPALEFVRLPVASAKKLVCSTKPTSRPRARARRGARRARRGERRRARGPAKAPRGREGGRRGPPRGGGGDEGEGRGGGGREAPEETSENDANDVAKARTRSGPTPSTP